MNAIDTQRWHRAAPYLDRVLDLPVRERAASIASLRSEDPEVAADIELLLAEHQQLSDEGFLEVPAALHRPEPALAGVTVGAYTLVSPIGGGGMGTVWLAARSDGRFEGTAALKLLNAALLGRAGEERFRREGTILARLTHPHIARLIDAGVSPTGQPFLVLEHIKGCHIDCYSDEHRLGVEDRIRLFLDVVGAVAHAHANLIVHRDLKPSNVLVTPEGQVKLLDFGIAKLLGDDAAAEGGALLTREGDIALTPKYAAPEQVTGGPITTATDVYALGVLLYELLSGQHPTGADAKSPAEFVRAVADTEPLRLSAAVPADAAIAASRATTPDRLRRALSGDLETIVAKALKTDPAERYASVAEFADDLHCFLDSQPIAARADAMAYRARKFVRRHQRVVAGAAAMTAVIVAVVAFYTMRLSTERDRARAEMAKAMKVSQLLTGLLTVADPYRTPDARDPTVQSMLDIGAERVKKELGQEPDLQAEMLTVIGRTYERMGMHAKARPVLERALAIGRKAPGPDTPALAQTLNDLGVLYRELGEPSKAEPLLRESLALRRRLLGPEDKMVAVTLVELSRVFDETGRGTDAEPLALEALAIRRKVFGEEDRETATSKNEVGRLLLRRGDVAGAEPYLRENAATTEHVLGRDHPNTAAAKANLAALLMARGDLTAAEALLREALDVRRRVFGDQHLEYAQSLNALGVAVELEQRLDEAQSLFEEGVSIARPQLPENHPQMLGFLVNLARIQIVRGKGADGAEPVLRQVLAARERIYQKGDWRIAQAQSLLGASLLARAQYAEAEPLMVAADGALKEIAGPQGRERAANRARLVTLYQASGRPQQAAAFR